MRNLSGSAKPVQDVAILADQFGQSRRLEQSRPKVSRNKSRKMLQLRADKANPEQQKMVAKFKADARLLTEVVEIYRWLDWQICQNPGLAGVCDACGRCCDFAAFDHRLFVTRPELLYLAANLGAEKIKPMPTTRCPYNISGKCSIYEHRFAGCRIFCCKSAADFQSTLSEAAVKKFRTLCVQLEIPYHYTDLATALMTFEKLMKQT